MSKLEPAQGGGPVKGNPTSVTPVPTPDGVRIIKGIGRAISAADRAETAPKQRTPERNRQDWRRG